VIYLTCPILPEVLLRLSLYITEIESIIATLVGFFSRVESMFSRLDSERILRWFPETQSLFALERSCPSVSSPEIYIIDSCIQFPSWSVRVDFPIPGSPERSMILPGTIPPPRTVLSSGDFVVIFDSIIGVRETSVSSFISHFLIHLSAFVSLNSLSEFHSLQY